MRLVNPFLQEGRRSPRTTHCNEAASKELTESSQGLGLKTCLKNYHVIDTGLGGNGNIFQKRHANILQQEGNANQKKNPNNGMSNLRIVFSIINTEEGVRI